MSFYILSNHHIFEHHFDYLQTKSGRRLEPTLSPRNSNHVADPINSVTRTRVIDVMSKKVISLRPQDSISEAFRILEKHQIHHLALVKDRAIYGILSDRDLFRVAGTSQLLQQELKLSDVSSRIVILCHEDTPLDHVAQVFYREKINGILVINQDKDLVGVVTHHDLLRWIFDGR